MNYKLQLSRKSQCSNHQDIGLNINLQKILEWSNKSGNRNQFRHCKFYKKSDMFHKPGFVSIFHRRMFRILMLFNLNFFLLGKLDRWWPK